MGETSAVAELVAEKRKLKKSLFRFDMIFFTVCAIVALDTIGASSAGGPQGTGDAAERRGDHHPQYHGRQGACRDGRADGARSGPQPRGC